MPQITVSDLTKNYGDVKALDKVAFNAASGGILTILGPSGAGKTTLLRCIAGLDVPDSGEIKANDLILFSSKSGISMPPDKRQIGMVFQSYAVWPHMTVFDNVAFPLKVRKTPKHKIEEKARGIISLVNLQGLENRLGTQLSAGQQQRVALGRALVADPQLLLLDEPLSNLDVKLR